MAEAITSLLQQRVPLQYIQISHLSSLIYEHQTEILETLIDVSSTNQYYSQKALQQIITQLERDSYEVEEDYYNYLAEWICAKPLQPTDSEIILYPLGQKRITRIREARNVISGQGTTGLRTWEAALHLTQYLLNDLPRDVYDKFFQSKNVVELGCGTGFVGISLFKYMPELNSVVLTDGDEQLVDNLEEIIELNGLQLGPNFQACKLWWGSEDTVPEKTDTIVAADVTYDASVIPSLIDTIENAMKGSVRCLILGATVRNEDTLAVWEQALKERESFWDWEIIAAEQKGLLWFNPQTAPIKLYLVTKK